MASVLPVAVRPRLATETVGWLTTLRPDGSPHVTPVWFVFDADADGDAFWIGMDSGSVKSRNLSRDGRVALALEDGNRPVVAEGRARLHGTNLPRAVLDAFRDKYDWDLSVPEPGGGERVVAEVTVTRWLLVGVAR